MKRPTLADPTASDISPHATNREAFLPHSKERLSTVENHSWASRDCFFMLGDLFQFTASNWVVINEYVNWEITSIEYKPEREEAGFRDLEIYLKDLYLHRRRVTRYYELINDTKDQIKDEDLKLGHKISLLRSQLSRLVTWKMISPIFKYGSRRPPHETRRTSDF